MDDSDKPTMTTPAAGPAGERPLPKSRPRSAFSERFAPGQMIASRYRIVGLLGRGGMGEVYRAEDLTLNQIVALKFLEDSLRRDLPALERFHAEVRNARQVSHPNVCRVYDIGEFDSHLFLAMEYVDGEDLAMLLRRIGRLPTAKANEVARQLCAGLGAAHDRGVLHRDLKPSNVMIDGDGRARITDFGLAVRVDDGAVDVSGTPAYMSPEQFEGRPLTAASDIYALGLILFEIYTGRRALEAMTVAEWRERHLTAAPLLPSDADPGIDPNVERAIVRCLEKDPRRRPASVRQLAAALPGGDPLAAALAIGDTPSPAMVAAAGGESALPLRQAVALGMTAILALAATVAISPYSTDLGLSRLSRSSDVLQDRAREIAVRHGYDAAADAGGWFVRRYEPMIYQARNAPSVEWRERMRSESSPFAYYLRLSPRPMVALDVDGALDLEDPPQNVSGMVTVMIDADARLIGFLAVPPQIAAPDAAAAEPDWSTVFAEAGFDRAVFTPQSPRWVPPVPYDAWREWRGESPQDPGVPLEVTAASFEGRLVSFEIHGPWSRAERLEPAAPNRLRISQLVQLVASLLVLAVIVFLLRQNFKARRSDHRGALRIGAFLAAIAFGSLFLGGHHVTDPSLELPLVFRMLFKAIASSVILVAIYLAVEPYVRRRMPELLIGWARLLEGRWRDPRVGRDVFIGAVCGLVAALTLHIANALPTWFNFPGQTTIPAHPLALEGGLQALSLVLLTLATSLNVSGYIFSSYFMLVLALRRRWVAMLVYGTLAVLAALGGENPLLELPQSIAAATLLVFVLSQYGLLAVVFYWWFSSLVPLIPLPLSNGAPYSATSTLLLLVVVTVCGLALRTSLGTRPVAADVD